MSIDHHFIENEDGTVTLLPLEGFQVGLINNDHVGVALRLGTISEATEHPTPEHVQFVIPTKLLSELIEHAQRVLDQIEDLQGPKGMN